MVLVAPVVLNGECHYMQLIVDEVVKEEILLHLIVSLTVVEEVDQRLPSLFALIVLRLLQFPCIMP